MSSKRRVHSRTTRHKHACESRDYFKTPIDVLLSSLSSSTACQVKDHDLILAYYTFTQRIRHVAAYLASPQHAEAAAVALVKSHSTAVMRCLVRDIQVASIPGSGHVNASDLTGKSNLCHRAIQLLSCLLAFPALASMFSGMYRRLITLYTFSKLISERDTYGLVSAILKVFQPHCSNHYNVRKTRSLVLWAVTNARLSGATLEKNEGMILEAITVVLNDADAEETCLADCFKVCLLFGLRPQNLTRAHTASPQLAHQPPFLVPAHTSQVLSSDTATARLFQPVASSEGGLCSCGISTRRDSLTW